MKILHTSDWHIGKKLMGKDRGDEYRAVLAEIADICEKEQVDLCLVAGDVFDTYTPSAEAEEIFYLAVRKIAEHSAVLIISGNHDDYIRLTAAATLAQELNIYIIGNNLQKIKCEKRGKCYPVQSDCGYVVFENGAGERVYIDTLPYPNEARFKEGRTDESFDDKISRWIEYGERGNEDGYPSIFLSHIFVVGGSAGDTEREIDLGGARLVKPELLPDSDYIALGHLHKRQRLGKNVQYCGAPMCFSFDEAGVAKSVNIFNIGKDGVTDFTRRELENVKKLVRLRAVSAEDGIKVLEANADCYVELTLALSEPLSREQTAELRKCPNLVSLKTEVGEVSAYSVRISNKGKSASQLFDDYYALRYGTVPPEGLKELFLSLTEEE